MTGQKDHPQQEENHHQVPTKQIGTNHPKKKAHQNAPAKEEELQATGHQQAKAKAASLKAALPVARKKHTLQKNHIQAGQVMAATGRQGAANHIQAE